MASTNPTVSTWTTRIVACVVCAAASAGCLVSSLHPAYDDASIVFDEALLGTWENRESEVTIVVSRAEWRSYRISHTDRFGTTAFVGHLTHIGTARFVNVLPAGSLGKPYVIATNGILQVEQEREEIRVRPLDHATMLKRAGNARLGIAGATDLEQNVLLLAPTAKLRAWLAAALKDPELWAEWTTLTKGTP